MLSLYRAQLFQAFPFIGLLHTKIKTNFFGLLLKQKKIFLPKKFPLPIFHFLALCISRLILQLHLKFQAFIGLKKAFRKPENVKAYL